MEINYFGDKSLEELAKILVKNPEQYDLQKKALKSGSDLGFIDSRVNLESSLDKLNQANLIANQGRVFCFEFESGYINRTEGYFGPFFEFYRLVGDELIYLDPPRDYSDFEDSIRRLNEMKVDKIFTGTIPEKKFFGLEPEYFDEDEDGYWQRLITNYIREFKKREIEVVDLGVLEE